MVFVVIAVLDFILISLHIPDLLSMLLCAFTLLRTAMNDMVWITKNMHGTRGKGRAEKREDSLSNYELETIMTSLKTFKMDHAS